jgi:hypothetical protein
MRNRKPADVGDVADVRAPVSDSKPQASTEVRQGTSPELLRSYAAYRRAQIYKPRIGGQLGGAHGVQAQAVEIVLREVEAIADWLDEGMPAAAAMLTASDLEFWTEAKRRGQEIPDDVKRALSQSG